MRTIEEVLNEMIGANYTVTNAQICEIMEIHSAEVAAVNIRIRAAYEAGRKHDKAELEKILEGEDGRGEWSCETCEHSGSGSDCWSPKECIQGSEWSQRNLNPFLKSTLEENGIRIPKDATDTNVGDMISRQAAIDAVNAMRFGMEKMAFEIITTKLLELPTAQPQSTTGQLNDGARSTAQSTNLIDRQQAIDALDCISGVEEVLRSLPPAQPEPKEGHWIDKGWNGDWAWQIDGRGNCWRVIECSECGKGVSVESNYCPHCGAKMKGAEHETD